MYGQTVSDCRACCHVIRSEPSSRKASGGQNVGQRGVLVAHGKEKVYASIPSGSSSSELFFITVLDLMMPQSAPRTAPCRVR
jgi:hypothetical protein